MLSDLQQRIASIVTALPEGAGFALAGGAALIVHGAVERTTGDLDYFATTPAAVDALLPAFERSVVAAGLSVERRQVAPGFARLRVTDADGTCEVDLCYDVRLRAEQDSDLGPLLSLEELAADKTLALFSRAAARDYIDVAALARRFGRDQLLVWAREKDAGFTATVFAEMLGRIGRLPRADFGVDDDAYDHLVDEIGSWKHALEELL